MKFHSKSSRHKSTNTFVFQSFNERIEKINISSIRRDKRHSALPQDADTFFGEALDKWTELNCTQHFVEFRAEISGEVRSLPQLIYHQQDIVEALTRNLLVQDSLALQPLLDLVVQLGRDLQADFYRDYFVEFFDVYKQLLNHRHHDVEALEQIFMSLAQLFKFLSKPMVQDIKNVYTLLSPLFRSDLYRDYINKFSAEAFSFLMRKVKNVPDLLNFMISSVSENHATMTSGLGHLLFEVVRGVQSQFHSCAEKFITVLVEKLLEYSADGGDVTLKQSLHSVMCVMWQHMLTYSSLIHFSLVSSILLAKLNEQHDLLKSNNSLDSGMEQILRLMMIWIKFKNGAMIHDQSSLVNTLLKLLDDESLSESLTREVCQVVRILLLASNCRLDSQHRTKLLQSIFKRQRYQNLVFDFTKGLHDLPLFEKDALPYFIEFCHGYVKHSQDHKMTLSVVMTDILQALVALISHKAPSGDCIESNFTPTSYIIDFSSAIKKQTLDVTFNDWMIKEFKSVCRTTLTDQHKSADTCLIWSLLCVIRHVRPISINEALTLSSDLVNTLLRTLSQSPVKENGGPNTDKELLWLTREALITVLHLLKESDSNVGLISFISLESILNLLRCHSSAVNCLEIVYLYLSWMKRQNGDLLSSQCFKKIFSLVEENLSSPQYKVRRLTLEICCLFDLTLPEIPPEETVNVEQNGIFRICLDAELTPATVQCYRDKLMHLRCLDQRYIANQIPEGISQNVGLRYLIGQLHVSLELLWKPTIELIKSYAEGLPINDFWTVFGPVLEEAGHKAAAELHGTVETEAAVLAVASREDQLGKIYTQIIKADLLDISQPKYTAFRAQLWTAMREFPQTCEPRSRIVVPVFLRFLEEEFYPQNLSEAPTQDLRASVDKDIDTEDDDVDDNDDDKDDDDDDDDNMDVDLSPANKKHSSKKHRKKKGSKKFTTKASNGTLITHLKLFTLFRDPRSLSQEPKLLHLYHELLKHKSSEIQKVAFECILTYKYPYLTPYKENFYRILDDKTFKDEIVLFSVESENTAIRSEHRAQLIPVLMSILYGKIKMRFGKSTGGRTQGHARKIILLSFIANSEPEEICVFLDLMFQSFLHLLSDDISKQVENVMCNVDISKTIPLRKMQGVLSCMELVIGKLGQRVEECYLSRILQVILCVSAMTAALLEKRSLINPRSVTLLKRIRNLSLTRAIDIFSMFEQYPFTRSEINALFTSLVWPQVEKLATDSAGSPTALLKLFCVWSRNPRYFCLLAKTHPEQTDRFCLSYIFQLLDSSQTSPPVSSKIIELIENLLSEFEEEEGETSAGDKKQAADIDVGPMCIDFKKSDLPEGLVLLMPHVPVILKYLTRVIENFVSKSGQTKAVPKSELNILSILSEHVNDEDQSCKIISLLLPFLGKKTKRSQSSEVEILKAVEHLMSNISQPRQFIPTLAALFSTLTGHNSRVGLCSAVEAACLRDNRLSNTASLVCKLNSWDKRHIEEPDYALRLEGFSEACRLLEDWRVSDGKSSDVDSELLIMLVYNCTYLISTANDLALRSNAMECLHRLVEAVKSFESHNTQLFQQIIIDHLLPEIKQGIKHKTEISRHGFIMVLENVVKNFSSTKVFSDLALLRDEVDVEKDFYHNITHVQIHRRSRALRRLAVFVMSVRLKNDTLTSFLLPIIGVFLRDEAYARLTDLHDACLEAVAAVSRCLPWYHYHHLLVHHLNSMSKQLTNQKLAVRIVVSILDNFHFDLKNSQFSPGTDKTNARRMESSVIANGNGKQEKVSEKSSVENSNQEQDGGNAMEVEEDKESDDSDNEGPGRNVECAQGLATRIHKAIVLHLLPQLHKCLTEKAKSDGQHKLAQAGKYAEDEEILRVPIALAMVKLLQTLPVKSLDQNLPSILLKVCQFLCSRAKDIRDTSRSTLAKILKSLGSSYFKYILSEMRAVLKRGYQVCLVIYTLVDIINKLFNPNYALEPRPHSLHVLCYTVWMLLEDMKSSLKPGDLDSCIHQLTEVFNEELFGFVAEEKEVDGIVSKVFEARTTKSIQSYALLASFVSTDSFVKIILPLKEVLMTTRSSKQSKKVGEVLQKMVDGLVNNSSVDLEQMMTFVYGLTSDSMADIVCKKKEEEASKQSKSDSRLAPPSTFLIKSEPARSGNRKPKAHATANMYLLIDFGLQLLYKLLRRSVVVASNKDHLKYLNPFIEVITSSLNSKHVRVTTSALRCLTWLLKFPLPSLKHHIKSIAGQMFVILKNYAVAGAGKGENFELVVMCFKAVTVLVRDVTYHKISKEQLQVLLGFAEQDLNDYTRRATAFSILKAILSRKLIVDEMVGIIQQVEQLSISSDAPEIQQQCRQVVLQYLLDYPLEGNKLSKHLEFFIEQREYEYESGRKSALEMLATIFNSFPQEVVAQYSGLFFVPLAERLLNEESTNCKELTALAIKTLITKLNDEQRDHLFSCCVTWMKNYKPSLRTIAAMSVGLFAEVETSSFERHLDTLLPLIEAQVSAEKYEQAGVSQAEQRMTDRVLFLYLELLLKIFNNCQIIKKPKWTSILNRIWGAVQCHLLYDHEWVRLAASQLFGILFSSYNPEELLCEDSDTQVTPVTPSKKKKHKANNDEKIEKSYLCNNLQDKLHALCGTMTNQLSSQNLSQDLADQIVKNLVHLAKIVKLVSGKGSRIEADDDEGSDNEGESGGVNHQSGVSIQWMVKRLCREVKHELRSNSKSNIKRQSVFKWFAAISIDLSLTNQLSPHLAHILRPLVRQVTDSSNNADTELKNLAQEVIEVIKKNTSLEVFNQEYSAAIRFITSNRDKRRNQRTLEVVTDPVAAARKKLKKNLAKQEAKKRKLNELRPTKTVKKPRMEHLAKMDSL